MPYHPFELGYGLNCRKPKGIVPGPYCSRGIVLRIREKAGWIANVLEEFNVMADGAPIAVLCDSGCTSIGQPFLTDGNPITLIYFVLSCENLPQSLTRNINKFIMQADSGDDQYIIR